MLGSNQVFAKLGVVVFGLFLLLGALLYQLHRIGNFQRGIGPASVQEARLFPEIGLVLFLELSVSLGLRLLHQRFLLAIDLDTVTYQ